MNVPRAGAVSTYDSGDPATVSTSAPLRRIVKGYLKKRFADRFVVQHDAGRTWYESGDRAHRHSEIIDARITDAERTDEGP